LINASECLKVPVPDREAEPSRSGMADNYPGDVDQPETELLDPQHAPRRFQMDGFENLVQGVSQKLKLKKDGCRQELFGQDMIDSEPFFQFFNDIFRIVPLPVEPDDFRSTPVGVGYIEPITVPKLSKMSLKNARR